MFSTCFKVRVKLQNFVHYFNMQKIVWGVKVYLNIFCTVFNQYLDEIFYKLGLLVSNEQNKRRSPPGGSQTISKWNKKAGRLRTYHKAFCAERLVTLFQITSANRQLAYELAPTSSHEPPWWKSSRRRRLDEVEFPHPNCFSSRYRFARGHRSSPLARDSKACLLAGR